MFSLMKDTIFSYGFFVVVRFGRWSTRPKTVHVIADYFKDLLAKVKRSKNICNYMKNLSTRAKEIRPFDNAFLPTAVESRATLLRDKFTF